MSSRKSRKSRSNRGSRTNGGGSAKRGRHSGNKGGKGLAGSDKHLYREITQKDPRYFGKHGFKRPSEVQEETRTINVRELDEHAEDLLDRDIADEKDGEIVIDASALGFDKVLGGGQVTHPLRIIADDFSDAAEKKLEESGGAAEIGEE